MTCTKFFLSASGSLRPHLDLGLLLVQVLISQSFFVSTLVSYGNAALICHATAICLLEPFARSCRRHITEMRYQLKCSHFDTGLVWL